jgi:sporulation protein YlmC with PRC-barrel domain
LHNKEIIGMKVISSDGWTVGTVSNLVTEPKDWSIVSIEVNVARTSDSAMSGVTEKIASVTTKLGNAPAYSPSTASPPQHDLISITPNQVEGVVDKITLKVSRSDLVLSSPESTETGSQSTVVAPA